MEFRKRFDRIWLEDETGREIAFVSFPARDARTVTIASTVVDDSLRGQGIAGALLDALAQELRASGRKAVPVCGSSGTRSRPICWRRLAVESQGSTKKSAA